MLSAGTGTTMTPTEQSAHDQGRLDAKRALLSAADTIERSCYSGREAEAYRRGWLAVMRLEIWGVEHGGRGDEFSQDAVT